MDDAEMKNFYRYRKKNETKRESSFTNQTTDTEIRESLIPAPCSFSKLSKSRKGPKK